MSLLLTVGSAIAKPFLLLTFACTNASMQDCEVYQDRFETNQECWNQALETNALDDSISLKHKNPKHPFVVTNCTEVPEAESSEFNAFPSNSLKPLGF